MKWIQTRAGNEPDATFKDSLEELPLEAKLLMVVIDYRIKHKTVFRSHQFAHRDTRQRSGWRFEPFVATSCVTPRPLPTIVGFMDISETHFAGEEKND